MSRMTAQRAKALIVSTRCTVLSMTFPLDVTNLLRKRLERDRRPPDGKLHPSGDLVGSLRHSQLRAAGAPTIESDITSAVRLMTGTNWHTDFESNFRQNKLPVMCEVKLDPWLPTGWSGTADWIVWNDERKAFDLADLKTIKGEGIQYVIHEGIKVEHMWQLSSYWYALKNMGLPLVKQFHVYYLPMNAPVGEYIEPILLRGTPLNEDLVRDTMESRWAATKVYLADVQKEGLRLQHKAMTERDGYPWPLNAYKVESLAPVQDRVQILRWHKPTGVYDVKLAPHWSAAYCPYPNSLCDCSEQGYTKIGHYAAVDGAAVYVPRKGYENVAPEVKLGKKEEEKLVA